MKTPVLYRKRLIPAQNILLKDDEILHIDDKILVTKWKTLNPKIEFSHGASCYFFEKGIKVSKFYMPNGQLLYWYCDIVDFEYEEASNKLTVIDLLADVLIYPDGRVEVVDLDEMADAVEQGVLSDDLLRIALRRLDGLLRVIYGGTFVELQKTLEKFEI